MSNPTAQSRLSVDFGVGKNLVITRSVRQNPSRLQHSPSLPNIWFPPHSGPLPLQMVNITRTRPQRPATPPPNMVGQIRPKPNADCATEERASDDTHGAALQVTNSDSENLLPNKADQLQDSDALHSLLTPPLTPSSSIATRSDSLGTRDNDTQITSSAEDADAELEASRFLLVSNVARDVHLDVLRASIIATLRDAQVKALSENNADIFPTKKISSFIIENAIKGVFVRCQESHGIVMLAFHDIRHAKLAKSALSAQLSGPLAQCAGSNYENKDANACLNCRFVTVEELIKTIGNSTFLASVDSTFYLAAEYHNRYNARVEEGSFAQVRNGKSSPRLPDTDDNDEKCGLNLSMLKKYLESFGDLRYFTPTDFLLGKDKDKDRARTFLVEYFDTREADAAFVELDGQVLFGMKLKAYRREVSNVIPGQAPPSECLNKEPFHQIAHQAKEGATSPLQSDRSCLKDGRCRILPPGQHSQTREGFPFDNLSGISDSDVSHNPSGASVPSPLSHHAPSPTYFYTSNSGNLFTPIKRESNVLSATGDTYVASNAADTLSLRSDLERNQTQNVDGAMHDFRYWNGDYQGGGYSYYYPRPDCFYTPSQRELTFINPTPSSPGFYPPIQTSTQGNSILYPIAHQPSPAYGFEAENSRVQPSASFQNWGLDHAIVTIGGPGPQPPPTPSLPGSVENWYPDFQAPILAGCPYYPLQICNSSKYTLPYYQKGSVAQQGAPMHGPPLFVSNTRSSTPCPGSNAATASQVAPSRSREPPPPPPERNQLNLARIEDGQDTRTTVMIKNIPNKMSDKDLLNFIHKVCPRRIDFLYLRMDFSNGCNVGYAFVNFIHVQDLLTFAKKKLGEKWNMFSSEKVLQMSYANYQGKEALVEKFKNSCIMDEREAWRPKIFYSDGPEQGLPEPFPSPTHLRRKERSSHNRGALYVPGVGSGLQTQLYTHVAPRRQAQQSEEHRGRVMDKEPSKSRDIGDASSSTLTRRGRC